jgi:hypothetical protein
MMLLELPVQTITDEIKLLQAQAHASPHQEDISRVYGAIKALEWVLGKHEEHIVCNARAGL